MESERDLLLTLLKGTAAETGQEFFGALVQRLTEALGVAGAWVTEYDAEQRKLRSFAFLYEGQWIQDFEYFVRGTPCELVVDSGSLVHYPERIVELFPEDPELQGSNAVSYMGMPLLEGDARTLGHLAVLDTKRLDLTEEVEAVFRIFAARAAAELRRIRAEQQIRESEERQMRLFDGAMDVIVELSPEGAIERVNQAGLAAFGGDVRGERIGRFLSGDSSRKLTSLIEASGSNAVWIAGGLTMKQIDGFAFPAEGSLSRYEVRGSPRYVLILRNVHNQMAAEQKIADLERAAACLHEELAELSGGSEMLGRSRALRGVLRAVRQVAPADAAVLITGETGTGKELVAREIHRASRRSGRALVRVNCAAIPAALMESEFFGHEKGAFTGATQRRTGRFGLADGGTLFLDEVGELPLELQSKLLRVLQEGEFEPVGSSQMRKVDVRVIAATNRDLAAEVKAGRFREDLYYRLNVFPIHLPPLRERGDDSVLLAETMVERACRRMRRSPLRLTPDALRRIRAYSWPGNVRELQNVMERAVIVSQGPELELAGVLSLAREAPACTDGLRTKQDLRRLEEESLRGALERCGWKVAGSGGAAKLLGLPPSTLTSRMKALGIHRPREVASESSEIP